MSNINNIEVVDATVITPTSMSTIYKEQFKHNIEQLFPKCVPQIIIDDDGNIECATVFVTEKITSDDCLSIQNLADDHELDFAIRSTGASQGLVIEFNK